MHARDYQPGQAVPGTVYRVLRLIGAGGMGTVYDVEDTTIGKRYVLKTLHPGLGARDDLARRMQNEARTLARLHHPNIVEVITAGITADDLRLPYYVMERLSGQSLRLVLDKKGRLELPHVYHIGIDLLDALDHAHDKGVIHRDVKPDNIFLHRTAAGVTLTKLLDFGIVSLLDGGSGETAGRFLGTLRYAAPEQLRGERPTPKTDIYSAALVLYEIATGRGPFDDEGDPRSIGSAHLHKPPPPASRFAPVPPQLDGLLFAALAKSPDDRPRDAFSFAASLRNLKRLASGPSHGKESTTSRTTSLAVDSSFPEGHAPSGSKSTSQERRPAIWPPPTSTASTGLPDATVPGMATPTREQNPVPVRDLEAVTRAAMIDRLAVTRTLAIEVSRALKRETERLSSVPTRVQTYYPAPAAIEASESAASNPNAWPAERSVSRSEEPQVRSVPAAAPARRWSGRTRLAAVGVAAAAITGVIASLVRQSAPPREFGGTAVPVATRSVFRGPADERMVPAPTIAPPAFDDSPGAHQPMPGAVLFEGRHSGAASLAEVEGGALADAADVPHLSGAPPSSAGAALPSSGHLVQTTVAAPRALPPASVRLPDRPGPGF